jgi:type II secretory pathway pseudopilin PulG
VELAMVLFIVSLVVGALLVPLATQMEARQRTEALRQLEEIREALLGYALIHGRLPCYTTETDPNDADYGEEDATCNPAGLTSDGILPWKTLGMPSGTDPWGAPRSSATDSWNGYWRYRVDINFFTTFSLTTEPHATSTIDVRTLNVTDSDPGAPDYDDLTSSSERPVAVVYSTGANLTADGLNAGYETSASFYEGGAVSSLDRDGDGDEDEFDDIVIWLTRPLLFSRLVSAGTLP